MAATSIWSVKGQLGKVLIYAENPEKTEGVEQAVLSEKSLQGLEDVIAYAVKQEKTEGKEKETVHEESVEIMRRFVSGINCTPMTARTEMRAVKKRYGKEDGIVAFHGYQSFAPDECTPSMAHEIGIRLAEELWGQRFQVLVATHLDKAHHLHNHFVVNSVSFADGLRYHRTKKDYFDMRQSSDRLCREYGLSVIKPNTHKQSKQYGEWNSEQQGRPTYRGLIRADVDTAIAKSLTEKQFYFHLQEMGYHIKFGKDITVRPQGKERGMKLARNFGDAYTKEAICQRILSQTSKSLALEHARTAESPKREFLHIRVKERPKRRIGGVKGLYLHYCYQLGIMPKKRRPVQSRRMHFLLREDLRKLDTISKEAGLLCRNHIETAGQLYAYKDWRYEQKKQLEAHRQKLRYKLRSIKNPDEIVRMKTWISEVTKQIGEVRSEIKLCEGIAKRSDVIKEKLSIIQSDAESEKQKKGKEGPGYEHIRRSR